MVKHTSFFFRKWPFWFTQIFRSLFKEERFCKFQENWLLVGESKTPQKQGLKRKSFEKGWNEPFVLFWIMKFIQNNPKLFLIRLLKIIRVNIIEQVMQKPPPLNVIFVQKQEWDDASVLNLVSKSSKLLTSFHTKWCKLFEAWTWPISKFDKNLPGCFSV